MDTPLRILHLEDDPADVRLVNDALRDQGLNAEITLVGDRPGFLATLERDDFDLILSDYKLPGFDGLQALSLWQAKWPGKPFIFVTGSMGEERAVESLKSGATDYILKENMVRLVPAIRRAVTEADEHARRQKAEQELRASHHELTKFNRLMVGRELRMIEMKKEVNELLAKLDQPPRYWADRKTADGPQPPAKNDDSASPT
ncbi:MAG: response regulator [Verrucomicrobia bacterium]|nr:response regulator [Verrucomicrobiota bacterium]